MGDGGNIKVCVRVRPFNKREESQNETLCIQMPTRSSVVCHDATTNADRSFTLDRAYWSHDPGDANFMDQQGLMDDLGKELEQNMMDGFNCCLFAYGQTGSGKTFSVIGVGNGELRGLLPRISEDLFATMEKEQNHPTEPSTFATNVTYVEIYNEQIRDLLAPATGKKEELQIHQNPKVGIFIKGLKENHVTSWKEVEDILDFGFKARSVGSTCMNDSSSRSHCIFTVEMQRTRTRAGVKTVSHAKLNLVDLAGSERQKKTEATGARLKEGSMINQSLSNLALVIHKLAELSEKKERRAAQKGGAKAAKADDFVPFRNSKLTFVLEDSLSGNSKTVMIAALSPAQYNSDETISTLRFCEAVKSIKTKAVKNEASEGSRIAELNAEVERLRALVATGGGEHHQSELDGMQALADKFGGDIEDQLANAAEMKKQRDDALMQMGLAPPAAGRDGVTPMVPQLVNMCHDPALQGSLVYFISGGDPVMLGASAECKIKVSGLGVKPKMCVFTNIDDNQLFFEPLEGRAMLNGRGVQARTELHHMDRLIFGHAFCFRVEIPTAVDDEKIHEEEVELLEHALDEIMPDDSEAFEQCRLYMKEMENVLGVAKTEVFLQHFRRLWPLIEEANAITHEIRPRDRLEFQVEALTDMFRFQEEEPRAAIRIMKFPTGKERWRGVVRRRIFNKNAAQMLVATMRFNPSVRYMSYNHEEYQTVVILDEHDFAERLHHMREVYESFHGGGIEALRLAEVEHDPWREVPPWAVGKYLRDKEHDHTVEMEELRRSLDAESQARKAAEERLRELEPLEKDRRRRELTDQASQGRIKQLEAQVEQLTKLATAGTGGADGRSPAAASIASLEQRLKHASEQSAKAFQIASRLLPSLQETLADPDGRRPNTARS